MSMHKKPLTDIERKGLEQHGLPVGAPSQLADSFRLGFAWALAQQGEPVVGHKLVPVEPTQAMIGAWVDAVAESDEHPVRAGYRAMLAAAPAAQPATN